MKIVSSIVLVLLYSITEALAKNIQDQDDELVSVVVLYRHGDRAPQTSYPNDPYIDLKYWPDGLGELLPKGKTRQFELGQWLRRRYNNFLSENYTPDEMLVFSTDVDRCHMSAQANLAGLYRPTGDSVWNEDLLWDPIPVHSIKKEEDFFLGMTMDCPKFDRLYDELDNSDYFKTILSFYSELVQYIEEQTKWNITSIDKIRTLHSVFYVYQMHNSSYIPDWADGIDPQSFFVLASIGYMKETFTNDLKRLHTGLFFTNIITYFDEVVNSNLPKFLMLSAHDTTIGSVLNSMSAYDLEPPEFTSTVIWELRKNQNGGFYINMFYKKPSKIGLKKVVLEGCDFNCNFDDFKNIMSNITMEESAWIQECNS